MPAAAQSVAALLIPCKLPPPVHDYTSANKADPGYNSGSYLRRLASRTKAMQRDKSEGGSADRYQSIGLESRILMAPLPLDADKCAKTALTLRAAELVQSHASRDIVSNLLPGVLRIRRPKTCGLVPGLRPHLES